jgi:hypothetical protein
MQRIPNVSLPHTVEEELAVQDRLDRIIESQGDLKAAAAELRGDLRGHIEMSRHWREAKDKRDDRVEERLKTLEAGQVAQDEKIRVGESAARVGVWFLRVLIVAVLGAGVAGQLGWLERLGRWMTR